MKSSTSLCALMGTASAFAAVIQPAPRTDTTTSSSTNIQTASNSTGTATAAGSSYAGPVSSNSTTSLYTLLAQDLSVGGAWLVSETEHISSVEALLKVPKLEYPTLVAGEGKKPPYHASFFVGVGCPGDDQQLLRAGINAWFEDGKATFEPFINWSPSEFEHFDVSETNFTVEEGNSIHIEINSDDSQPFFRLINLNNKGSVTFDMTESWATGLKLPNTTSLCTNGAVWGIEEFGRDKDSSGIMNFNTVVFDQAFAYTWDESPRPIDMYDAKVTDFLAKDGQTSACSIVPNKNRVSCQYMDFKGASF